MRPVGILLAWVAALLASTAGAATSTDLCPGASNPCVIGCGTARVTADATLDFGQCDLVLTASARLRVRTGVTLRILAQSVRLATGAQVDGTGTTQTTGAIIRFETTGSVTVESGASVDVSGNNGGTLLVRAGGDAAIGGPLTATALAAAGRGGLVGITAAGAITIDRAIDVSGGTGDGGDIDLDGATVAVNGSLLLDGASPGGGGGDLTVSASRGPLTITAPVSASGARGTANTGGGTGGDLSLSAAGDFRLAPGASLTSTGGPPDGDGGRMDVDVDGAFVAQGGMDASTVGTGSGGSISLTAGGALSASGALAATGGSGGDVDLAARTTATVTAAIDTSSTGGDGDGGGITVKGNPVVVTGMLAANGDTRRDVAGSVSLAGCGITLGANAELDSKGVSGLNLIQGSGTMVLAGTLNAAPSGGNRVEYRDQSPSLSLRGATPAPTVVRNATLAPCPGTATTTTTSTTTSTVTTSSRVPTSTSTSSTRPAGSTTTSTTASTLTTTTSLPHPTTSVTSSTTVTPTTSSTSTTRPGACTPLDCDDQDGCTLDTCDVGTCVHSPLEDIDAIACRLDALVADVSATPVGRTTATIRERLLAKIGGVRRLVERARVLGRRQATFLSRADRRLKGLAQFVDKARALGRIDPAVADTVVTLVDEARAAIAALR